MTTSEATPAIVAAEPPSQPGRPLLDDRAVALIVTLYTAILLGVSLLLHPTPLYFVETDLVGEYIPAARSLAAGRLDPGHFAYKGPGYPLMLAAVAPLCGGDDFLAARIVSVVATGGAAWLAFLVVRLFAGPAIALLALAALMFNPTFVRYGIEAGTDAPALALSLLATYGVMRAPARGWLAGAGLAAGFAVITRYNAAFLLPAAALVLLGRPRRLANLASYAAGAALPIAAWVAIGAQLGHGLRNDNYLTIAYELYGRGLPLDQFGARIGSRFHSLADVLAFDPARAVARIVWNLGAHFVSDLHDLVPPWLGALAGPGLLLGCFARRGWRPAAFHVVWCSLILAPVFYSARFSLYLLPFHLAGAAFLMVEIRDRIVARAGELGSARLRTWAPAVAGALVLASGVAAVDQVGRNLAAAPHESRIFGRLLAERGLAGQRIMARKPHVAYFAGMDYASMGVPSSVLDLIERARASQCRYLLYSPIERVMRPEFAVLSDSGLALPGLEQIAYRSWGGHRDYAIYRVTDVRADSATMAAALDRALERYLERRPDEPEAQVFAAIQLLDTKRYREALGRLSTLEVDGASAGFIAGLTSTAFFGLEEWEQSYRACQLAIRVGPPSAWHYARLGAVREKQHRMAEARDWYRRAVDLEPGNPDYLQSLGLAHVAVGEFGPASAAFERCLALSPRSSQIRRYAMGAYQLAGNERRAREILDAGVRIGIPTRELLDP